MRHTQGMPLMRRATLIIAGAIMAAALVTPAFASALMKPTIRTSSLYQPVAKSFTISGRVSSSLHGKHILVRVRKPGRTFWTTVGSYTISKTGRYSMSYFPKLGGKFYVRAVYSAKSYSRIASLTVKRGPGKKYVLRLSSTTSTQDSGLFEALLPQFEAQMPEYDLQPIFVGSGAAIANGGTGAADVLLTHSPAAELDFMKGIVAGAASAHKGLTRYKVMYNHFVLVGPKSNPAGITLTESAQSAFAKIASTGSTFYSRNDNSGTNAKEKEIWAALGNPQTGKSWYKATGTMGMAQALAAANDGSTGGYTLADNATWLMASRLKTVSNLQIINEGDSAYFNQYSVIEVKGARNAEGAQDFRRWIMTAAVQKVIREYGVDWYGVSLFIPNAGSY